MRHTVSSAGELLSQDSRPPVVYLRPFSEDPATAANPVFGFMLAPSKYGYALRTEEEQVSEVMNEIGPFIAIGRPGESLPALGAAREYVSDLDWQAKVIELVSKAQLVLVRPGPTKGFWWEIETIVKSVPANKVALLIPYDKEEYEGFRQACMYYFPRPLPEYPKWTHGWGTLRAVVYFSSDWTAKLQSLDIKNLKKDRGKPLVAMLKAALDPVVRELGLRWKYPPQFIRFFSPSDLIIAVPLILIIVSLVWLISSLFFR
jgi:hypothetical protein